MPFLIISPYAKQNYVDHTLTDQTSIIRFIEDNWLSSQRITGSYDAIAGVLTNMLNLSGTPSSSTLILDPSTGQPAGLHELQRYDTARHKVVSNATDRQPAPGPTLAGITRKA